MDRLTFLVLVEHNPRAIIAYRSVTHDTYYHAGCFAMHMRTDSALKCMSGPIPLDTVPLGRMCPKCSVPHHGRPDTHPAG